MAVAAAFVAALNRRDRAGAVAEAERLLATNAALGGQWRAVARFAAHVAEWPVAIAAMRRAVEHDPGDLEGVLQLADMLANAGRLDETVALIGPRAKANPRDARLRHLLGTAHIQLGDTALGVEHLAAAAALAPASGMTWLALASARVQPIGSPEADALFAAEAAMAGAAPTARAAWLYAVGKVRDDAGEHDQASDAFAQGAALVGPERGFDAEADRAAARSLVDGLDREWLNAAALPDQEPTGPILVTGLPRSGTTLVEQMLASHSGVAGGGELNLLDLATAPVGGVDAGAVRRRFANHPDPARAWGGVAPAYRRLLARRWPGGGRAVDKSLNTSRYAGVVRLAMPDARIVWMRRDPLDNAWSCFRTFFAQGLGWSFRLQDIARHFAAEDLLFEHWRGVLGDRMLVVPYAELVTDTESWLPRIAAHVGLSVEPAMFDFHRSKRAVATASVAQVRRPVYRSAIGSAAPHAARLAPFTAAYAAARAELGLPPSVDA